jgi:hypothetical protein
MIGFAYLLGSLLGWLPCIIGVLIMKSGHRLAGALTGLILYGIFFSIAVYVS